jgi:cellulose synthase/poly-beta-1,6-N-acetylglucosamine synthase-like glycosyltransferase
VSVVVPTRDRPHALRRCLGALDAQDTEGFEVVVVDDRSLARDEVHAVVAGSARARVVDGAGRGPAAARNLGVRSARGDVLCFTDDDCAPAREWVRALVARVDRGSTVVAGPTRPGAPSVYVRASQIVTNQVVEASRDGDAVGFAPTSNIACRRAVHEAVPFDEHFPTAAGEDRAWCDALRAAGHRIDWSPGAWVAHTPELDARAYWRQHARYGAGAYRYFHGASASRSRRERAQFTDALVRRAFLEGVAVGALVLLAQGATAVGYAEEAIRARRAG